MTRIRVSRSSMTWTMGKCFMLHPDVEPHRIGAVESSLYQLAPKSIEKTLPWNKAVKLANAVYVALLFTWGA